MQKLLYLLILLPGFGFGQICADCDELYVTEPFDYAPFNGMFAQDGGTGWTTVWNRAIGEDAIFLRGDLSTETIAAEEGGTRALLRFVRAGIRYNRRFEGIREADDTGDLWFSAVLNWEDGGPSNNVGNVTVTYNDEQVFSFGRKFGNRRIAIVLPGGTNFETPVVAEGTHHLVLKLKWSNDGSREQAFLWVDPPMAGNRIELAESTADAATPTNAINLPNGINGIQLKVEGTPPLTVEYDHFRMGNSFQAILPDFTNSLSEVGPAELQMQLSPNPAAGVTRLSWQQPHAADRVAIELYTLQGSRIAVLTERPAPAGSNYFDIPVSELNLKPGAYLVRYTGRGLRGGSRLIVR